MYQAEFGSIVVRFCSDIYTSLVCAFTFRLFVQPALGRAVCNTFFNLSDNDASAVSDDSCALSKDWQVVSSDVAGCDRRYADLEIC